MRAGFLFHKKIANRIGPTHLGQQLNECIAPTFNMLWRHKKNSKCRAEFFCMWGGGRGWSIEHNYINLYKFNQSVAFLK